MSLVQKRKFDKKSYYGGNKRTRTNFMEVGQRGFLATCNFREKDCVREAYNLLNEYYDKLYGQSNDDVKTIDKTVDGKSSDQSEEELDIQDELDLLAKAATDKKSRDLKRFQAMSTDTANCVFIKTTIENPMELCQKIFEELSESKRQKTRFLLRFIPVQEVCKANIKSIVETVGKLWDKHILSEKIVVHSFAVVFNKRYNNDVAREDILKELADLVKLKCPLIKVDLKGADLCVLVEILKGFACISIAPGYFKYRKYNLIEICSNSIGPENETKDVSDTDVKNKIEAGIKDVSSDENKSPTKNVTIEADGDAASSDELQTSPSKFSGKQSDATE